MSYSRPRGRRRPAPLVRALAVLALATLASATLAAALPASAGTSARPGVAAARPEVLVLVGRLTWAEAVAAARGHGGPLTAGLLATLPGEAPLADRVLSMAAAERVRGADADPARLDRFRAATPDGCYRRLPPVEVMAAAGMEDAGLLAVREGGTPPPTRPLPATGPLTSATSRLLVVAVPDAHGLSGVLGRLPAGDRVLVAGLQPAPGRARTIPLLDLGGPPGLATSVSTRRDGLVALVDLCPTLVGDGDLGDGAPVSAVASADPLAAVTRLDRRVAALVVARTWAIPLLVLAAVLAAAGVGLAWRSGGGSGGLESEAGTRAAGGHAAPSGSPPVNRGSGGLESEAGTRAAGGHAAPSGSPPVNGGAAPAWTARAVRGALLLTLAMPSGYLVASRIGPTSALAWLALGVGGGALLAVAVAAAFGPDAAGAAGGRVPMAARRLAVAAGQAPVVLGLVLLALVVADLATGGHGLERPLLGGSAYDGERFYGLGNGYFAMALASVMLVAAFTRLPAVAVAAMLGGLALVDGLPMLGADVGGALTASLTAGLALLLLGRRRGLAATVLLLGLAALGGLAVVGVAALIADPSTHGSRFLGTLLDEGPAAAGRVVTHQLGRNFALLRGSPVAWVGPLEVLAAALLATRPPAALATVPERARRVVLLGALGSALLVLLNDTGVTAIAASGLFLLAILVWSVFAPGQPDATPGPPPDRDTADGAGVSGRPARSADR